MAAFTHYSDGNVLEDVLMQVINTTPHEAPFMTSLSNPTKVTEVIHQWPEDTLTTYSSNAQQEGGTYSDGTLTAPARRVNLTQVLWKTVFVSRTEQLVRSAGISNNLDYQKMKGQKMLATDMEKELITSSMVSGNGTNAARRMAGALAYITTNATTVNSGTKLTESLFNDMIELVYNASGKRDLNVLTSAFCKRKISNFYARNTVNADQSDKSAHYVIDRLITDVGDATVAISRVTPTSASAHTLLFYDREMVKLGVLDAPHWVERAKTAHGDAWVIETEITLEVRSENTGAVLNGINPNW